MVWSAAPYLQARVAVRLGVGAWPVPDGLGQLVGQEEPQWGAHTHRKGPQLACTEPQPHFCLRGGRA